MKFLIFVKQVPSSAEIRFDLQKKTLIREGVKSEMNAYDRRAITEAIRYRNEHGGEVVAATMGPPSSSDSLREALIMGVDSCIHIQDSRLAGSDTLVTARVLAALAKKIGFDIIFCGQHSTDSETGQVPVELAELLGIPCAIAIRKIEYLPNSLIQVTSETDEGSLLLEIPLPVVLTAAERLIKPLKTKNADLTTAPNEKIRKMNLDQLEIPAEEVGLEASPTWVADIVDVRVTRSPEIWDGGDVQDTAARLVNSIRQSLSSAQQPKDRVVSKPASGMVHQAGKSFWCWIELMQSKVRSVSLEILSAAASLAAGAGGSVSAIVVGRLNEEVTSLLASHGASEIYNISQSPVHPDQIVGVLERQIIEQKPFAVFFPATSQGKYLAPRIAARMCLGLTGDCVGLEFTPDGKLAQLKPAFGGNIVARIHSRTYPQMATIRPGALDNIPSSKRVEPNIVSWRLPEVAGQFTVIAQEIDPGIEAVDLDDAEFVVGIGAGLGQENVRLAERLADLLGGSTGATRRVVDSGWMPRQFQIGLTGKFISPNVYLGAGVSGRYNHMIGVQKSNRIIAINQDRNAEIFQTCDIGVHGDCVAILGEMIRILESSKE